MAAGYTDKLGVNILIQLWAKNIFFPKIIYIITVTAKMLRFLIPNFAVDITLYATIIIV